jgi:glycosyltransferase involved in cell wall biosynthesis
MTPAVSVIIPCKNAAAWLAQAIESCLGQTWSDLEVIVVDNGSSDASLTLARSYLSRSVKVLECARQGASAARNAGLEQARGAFIQFLDADDVLHPDKVRSQMERLACGPTSSIASGAWARFRQAPSEAVFSAEPVWRDSSPSEFLISSWLGGGMMPNFAWLTPRTAIDKAGPWNERLSLNDDGEFFTRVVLASSGIVFCAKARGYYRRPDAPSLSRRRDEAALASAYTAIELSCANLLKHCHSPEAARACATQFLRFAFGTYPDAPDLVEAAERYAKELGGSGLRAPGGRGFQVLSNTFGWKFAKRSQRAWQGLKALLAPPGAIGRSGAHAALPEPASKARK